jgi:hypothetical protein
VANGTPKVQLRARRFFSSSFLLAVDKALLILLFWTQLG